MKKIFTKFFIFLSLIQIIFSQNASELIQPKCSSKKIEYSIVANMKEYLEHENNIDGRELYSTIDDLKSKKVGTLSFFTLDGFTNVEKYDSLDDLVDALRKHKVDAIFVDNTLANYTQVFTNDLSQISSEINKIYPAFIFQKNSSIYQKLLEFQNKSKERGRYYDTYYKWMGINEESIHINKTISRNNGLIKALFFNYPPFMYKDEEGELVGSIVQFLYAFCKQIGYQVDLKETSSIDELNQAIKSNSFDIVYYFIQEGNAPTENSYILFGEGELNPIIRFSNHPESVEWYIYDSVEQFNGAKLGCVTGYVFEYLYKENFPDSEIKYYNNNYDCLYYLLKEEIEGFIADEHIAKRAEEKFPERITYFDINATNDIGFGFKKIDNNPLLNEFNEFIEKQNTEKLYEKWNAEDTSNLKVDKGNYQGEKTIKVGLLANSKPFCFMEDEEDVKGLDVELIYEFAKSKNYNVDLVIFINIEDRMKIREKDSDLDIVGGDFTITEERAKTISFSNPTYKVGTSLIVRRDIRKDTVKLSLLDGEYNKIPDNKAKLYSKVGDKTLTSFCAFPDIYNYTIAINCSINDFNGTDPFTQGIESTTTEDKLYIMFSYLEIDNLLKANEKLKLSIIQESDKTEHICSEENRVKESNTSSLIPAIIGGVASIGLLITILSFCL